VADLAVRRPIAHAWRIYTGLAYDQLEHKMRLLTLTALAFQNVGTDVPYATIATTLRVEPTAVESWVIDGAPAPLASACSHTHAAPAHTAIRAGLLVGKLSQSTQTLRVLRASARAFERPQWALLETRLAAARASLAQVLDVVASARRGNEHGVAALAAAEEERVEKRAAAQAQAQAQAAQAALAAQAAQAAQAEVAA
jgi:translation initiation factor 3 subunit M